MTKTEYLQLIKEGEEDFYSIDTVNRNLDKIDSMFGKLAWFCVCGSRKMDVNKIVDAEGFQLFSGVRAIVYFTWGNTAENITMNINGTGAYPVKYKNEPLPAGFIQAEWALEVVYHAGCWRVVGDLADKRAQELAERIDGMTPSDIGALPVSGNAVSASKWNTARKINGMSIDGTADRTNYGVCSTSGSTAAKTVSCAGFNLATGAEITVKFNNTNTSTNPTLNVNGTGAKAIYYKGVTVPSGYIVANGMYTFRYNGTQWEYVGDNTQKQVDDMTTRLNNLKASDIDALPVSGNAVSASKWNTTRKINGMSIDGTADRTNYGVCYTEGSVALKTVSCPGFSLVTGAEITVKFKYENTTYYPTLNVNGTGAKDICYRGTSMIYGLILADGTYTFRYNGTDWDIVGDIKTYSLATSSSSGLMSAGDKLKMDSLDDNYADKDIYGDAFVSMGRKAGTTVGAKSHAFGDNVEASHSYTHAEGSETKASGLGSHAEGDRATASGYYAHAEGSRTTASGNYSHAEGNGTTASKECSHAEGYNSIASQNWSHAEGYNSIANNYYTHAEGSDSTAGGMAAHAEGKYTSAEGMYSHSEGFCTISENFSSHVGGKYNKNMVVGGESSNQVGDVFVIGNGTSNSARSNALRVTYLGDIKGTKAFQSSGADYAEFIKPWADGNSNDEDRVGYFVTVKDGFLHKAEENDYIYGITSGNPSIVGNADEDYYWRYERDEFNRIVMEDVPETVPTKDEEGHPIFDKKTHEPVMVETGKMILNARMKLAEGYDPSLQGNYIERKDRKEWDYVGMLGVLPVRDDGTCLPGHYCKCGQGGVATIAEERGFDTYMVIERISDNIVSVILK